jgi:hypothetical protein
MSSRCTVVLKEFQGKELLRFFAQHSSFRDITEQISSNFSSRSGNPSAKWYIPMHDPVDGPSRELCTEVGYKNWMRSGSNKILEAFLITENFPETAQNGKERAVVTRTRNSLSLVLQSTDSKSLLFRSN